MTSVSRGERIVVRCPNWLGDVVMSTPALRALRRGRPKAHVVALLPPPLAPLLEGLDVVDEIWPLASRGDGGLAAWRADRARLAERRFDLGLVLPESVSSAWLLRAGRVRRIAGFARDPLRRALLHDVLEAPTSWGRRRLVSRERFAITLVEAAVPEARSVGSPDLRLALGVTEAEETRLEAALAEAGTSGAELAASPPIVIAPGASFGPSKCWPAPSYAELADRLAERGHSVVLIGAPGESARVRAVEAGMKAASTVLDGTLDLGALKALLRGARALVANDAGARHVAAAFGVPSVVFFGPTSVEKTADNLDRIEILETAHDCRPCYRRTCPIDHRCLRSIPVDAAFDATERALSREAG